MELALQNRFNDWQEKFPEKEISVRTAVVLLSMGHGQGVMKCRWKKVYGGNCKYIDISIFISLKIN